MADDATNAIGVAMLVGAAVSPMVFAAVSATRKLVAPERRRAVLTLSGVLYGWIFTALVMMQIRAAADLPTVALALLGGFWSYAVSAGLNAQGKTSREGR